MKLGEIISSARDRLGIASLNPMQEAMTKVTAPLTLLIAPTGSGKTLAFMLPVLMGPKKPCGHLQALIVAPSRELVLQISDVIRQINRGFKIVACYGGHNMLEETRSLQSAFPDIIVATPGRLCDHLQRGNIPVEECPGWIVLDEYDKSLELGFADEMARILRRFKKAPHIILTSATRLDSMPDYFPKVDPVVLDFSVKENMKDAPRSRMRIVNVISPSRDKLETLDALIRNVGSADSKMIVFVNHRESAERVYKYLVDQNLPAGLYHGGMEQNDRENAIHMLNNGTTPILVSTDLASRGLDIDSVDSVIHYHLPVSEATWTHRNGRTARQDATGSIYVITSDGENIPEFVDTDNDFYPLMDTSSTGPVSKVATLYFNLGKKEKISRGDIVGFLIANTSLSASDIGHIDLSDHYALVAIPRKDIDSVLVSLSGKKIKKKRVKVTPKTK